MADKDDVAEDQTTEELVEEEVKDDADGAVEDEGKEDGDDKEDGAEENDDKDKDDEESEGAPEEYAEFTIADGFEVNDEQLTTFKEFGKANNLTQEAAQKLVDLHTSTFDAFTQGQQDAWDNMKAEWAEQSMADKDLHGEDGKADAAIALAGKAVETIGGKDLKEAFDLTGAGNHPAVVKAFYELGKRIEEDQLVFDGSGEDTRSPAEKLFPTMVKK